MWSGITLFEGEELQSQYVAASVTRTWFKESGGTEGEFRGAEMIEKVI